MSPSSLPDFTAIADGNNRASAIIGHYGSLEAIPHVDFEIEVGSAEAEEELTRRWAGSIEAYIAAKLPYEAVITAKGNGFKIMLHRDEGKRFFEIANRDEIEGFCAYWQRAA